MLHHEGCKRSTHFQVKPHIIQTLDYKRQWQHRTFKSGPHIHIGYPALEFLVYPQCISSFPSRVLAEYIHQLEKYLDQLRINCNKSTKPEKAAAYAGSKRRSLNQKLRGPWSIGVGRGPCQHIRLVDSSGSLRRLCRLQYRVPVTVQHQLWARSQLVDSGCPHDMMRH